jgi:CRP-like cAMP-binding protein
MAASASRWKTFMNNVKDRRRALPGGGPVFTAASPWTGRVGQPNRLLAEDRARLADMATVVRFRKGETIYRQGETPTAVFNIVTGMVKVFKIQPDKSEHIVEFLFQNDLAGLAEDGGFVNSAKALTQVTLYRFPATAVEARLRTHSGLDFQVICKLCHELREAQRHAYLLSRSGASARLSLFLIMLSSQQASQGETGDLFLPMNRTEIGAYAGLSPEAVSRSFRQMAEQGLIGFSDRRHLRVLDPVRLRAAASSHHRTAP